MCVWGAGGSGDVQTGDSVCCQQAKKLAGRNSNAAATPPRRLLLHLPGAYMGMGGGLTREREGEREGRIDIAEKLIIIATIIPQSTPGRVSAPRLLTYAGKKYMQTENPSPHAQIDARLGRW